MWSLDPLLPKMGEPFLPPTEYRRVARRGDSLDRCSLNPMYKAWPYWEVVRLLRTEVCLDEFW